MPLDDGNEVVVATRERLYRQHIYSAHLFAERAQALEGRDPREMTGEDRWRHRAYVTGTIFAAAAFFAASINELYVELKKLGRSGSPKLPPRELSLLSQVWPDVQGSTILHKYQVALSLADADSYDESK